MFASIMRGTKYFTRRDCRNVVFLLCTQSNRWRTDMRPYKDKRWRSKRDTALRRDKYECRNCKRFGITTTATVVHHVWFLRDYPKWWLCLWNLISLCDKCHNKMHNRDSDIPTELGEYWQDKIKPPASSTKKYL